MEFEFTATALCFLIRTGMMVFLQKRHQNSLPHFLEQLYKDDLALKACLRHWKPEDLMMRSLPRWLLK